MPPPKKVIVFGTFDILHPGHLNFFSQAKKAGGLDSKLVVVIGRDLNVKQAKGLFPINNETTRLLRVKKVQEVDDVLMGDLKDKISIIEKTRPDIICLGYDQELPENFEAELKKRNIKAEVRRLNAYQPDKFKSSKLKQ
ncbi:FAD synthase [Candidatus Woesearchaeota archaeon CG10_big_fil_rev_8_21_14_0_10_44_13]|nr:MAG: FAD synthase [Candidatus Woesearchaeota archaeon CG10_big_fil_rev_8_21_14_0_10_44_13]